MLKKTGEGGKVKENRGTERKTGEKEKGEKERTGQSRDRTKGVKE